MFSDLSLMNDIKQRSERRVTRRDRVVWRGPRGQEHPEKTSHVKLRVTPLSTLMVQELLSLQLRFLGQRRGQAYSESKSPSHTLHITRLIPDSDSHRKRICNLRLHFRLPSNCQFECSNSGWDHLGQDRQRHRHLLRLKPLHSRPSPKFSPYLHFRKQHHSHYYRLEHYLHRAFNPRSLRVEGMGQLLHNREPDYLDNQPDVENPHRRVN